MSPKEKYGIQYDFRTKMQCAKGFKDKVVVCNRIPEKKVANAVFRLLFWAIAAQNPTPGGLGSLRENAP